MKLLVFLALAISAVSSFRYDGYRLLEVGPLHDEEKVKFVISLTDDDERIKQVILLNEHVLIGKPIELAVSPLVFDHIANVLHEEGILFAVTKEDLQKFYDESMVANEIEVQMWQKSGRKSAPTAYLRHDEQVAWLREAVAGSSIAETFSIGTSYEGRDLIGVVINGDRTDLPTVWIDANIHAREWITSASTLYIIDQILTGTSDDAVNLRENYRWYILPNANPDGYEFSWSNDRQWRKTRSPNSGSPCIGTDPNRNWDENWGGAGSGLLPCSDTYAGPSAFSEPETRSISQFLTTIADSTNVYISIHSYTQLWLVPWSSYSFKPADYDELMRVGNLAAAAIKSVNGLDFTVGTPPDILYVASGCSFDWAKAKLNIAYAYGPELRPLNANQGGFVIPPSNITPSGAEIFAGIVATVTNAQHKINRK